MNSKQILIRVREIINAGWCRNKWSADEHGNFVSVEDRRACQFCIRGALVKTEMESYPKSTPESIAVFDQAKKAIGKMIPGGIGITPWQDNPKRTKEEVLAVIDMAIASVKEQEKIKQEEFEKKFVQEWNVDAQERAAAIASEWSEVSEWPE